MSYDTMGEIVTEVTQQLRDQGNNLATPDNIKEWWHRADIKFAKATGYYVTEIQSVPTIKGVREYDLPGNYWKMKSVHVSDPKVAGADQSSESVSVTWATTPIIVVATDTNVVETVTLTVTAIYSTSIVFSVTGSLTGAHWTYRVSAPNTLYTTNNNASGIGGGLSFAIDYSELTLSDWSEGDTVTISVDPGWTELKQTGTGDLDASYPGWRNQVGQPMRYYTDENRIGYQPGHPDEVYGIKMEFEKIPTKVTSDSAAPNTPDSEREEMINWIFHKAWAKARRSEQSLFFKTLFKFDIDEESIKLRQKGDRVDMVNVRYKHGWTRRRGPRGRRR